MLRPSLPTAPLLMVAPLIATPWPPVMLAARAMYVFCRVPVPTTDARVPPMLPVPDCDSESSMLQAVLPGGGVQPPERGLSVYSVSV
ncbi:hypothetical protein NB696_002067 [Xanthomonas sacchari]|nr:hypothetical protein [Xanthomonas sacchari]